MRKLIIFLKDLKGNYNTSPGYIAIARRACYIRAIGHIGSYSWSILTAPLIYPIWYIFRYRLAINIVLSVTNVPDDMDHIKKQAKKYCNWFTYWLWTYGDLHDPLGRGGMPEDYRNGENSFINRFWYSAIRNPRFTYNFLHYQSEPIINTVVSLSERDYSVTYKSNGIKDSIKGRYLVWRYDGKGKTYFLYENNTDKSLFYIGWVGLDNNSRSRFEIGYRMNPTKVSLSL